MEKKIRYLFNNQFFFLIEKFSIITLPVSDAKDSSVDYIWHPGVYIFWRNEEVIKVGRSFTNSRKRSLEHLRDGTKIGDTNMSDLSQEMNLTLINCINSDHYHWTAALEIYMEKVLEPTIPTKRQG